MQRRHLFAMTVAVVCLAAPAVGRAQFAVIDAGNLIQTTATALSTAQTVINTYTQIERLKDQIKNQVESLKNIDPTSFSDLKGLFADTQMNYQRIRNDASSIGFSVDEVNRDFDGLFPKDKGKWKDVRYADYDGYYTRWNAELTSSAKTAERAQANIIAVERNNKAIADILARSDGAGGEVRQLQLINQQLAVIHQELGALVQTLTTASRVNANMAAAAAGERMLTREAKGRRRDGYTNLGKPARLLKRLP